MLAAKQGPFVEHDLPARCDRDEKIRGECFLPASRNFSPDSLGDLFCSRAVDVPQLDTRGLER